MKSSLLKMLGGVERSELESLKAEMKAEMDNRIKPVEEQVRQTSTALMIPNPEIQKLSMQLTQTQSAIIQMMQTKKQEEINETPVTTYIDEKLIEVMGKHPSYSMDSKSIMRVLKCKRATAYLVMQRLIASGKVRIDNKAPTRSIIIA